MNSRRSFLDTLNAGRQRRPDPTFEDLDRTLANLEGKLQRGQAPKRNDVRAGSMQESWTPRRPESAFTPRPDLKTLARDLEAARRQEDSLSSIGKIASELKAMREELRQQMGQGLKREFDALRHDIQRLYAASPTTNSAELGAEFERLSDAVRSLAERSDDKSVNMLRLELEQVKNSLDTLAREDTLNSVGRRWEDFDRRWSSLEGKIEATGAPSKALNQQLEEISQTINRLPESLSVRALDDRMRALAGSVEQFAQQYGNTMPEAFSLIEQRLDEISRAIAASAAAQQPVSFDPEPFQRIEARVSSLARQIEELTDDHGSAEVIDRLSLLSQRVDEIAQRVEIPETIVARLAEQIAIISDRLESDPVPSYPETVFQGLEDRFEQLSQVLERRQGDAMEQGHQLFRELERRLEEMADRMDRTPVPASDSTALQGLENRLEDISRRLELSARQAAGIDAEVVRNLEAQVTALSAHMAKPGQPLPEFEDIAPLITHLEQSLAENRQAILEAARRAAQEAVGAVAQTQPDNTAVAGLAGELKSLESLARRSDERNAKTFEAIHDTLLKIVYRLGAIEQGGALSRAGKTMPNQAPSLDADDGDDGLFGRRTFEGPLAPSTKSPAEAAAAAASFVLGDEASEGQAEPPAPRKSMLSGLTRAFRKDRESAQPAENAPIGHAEVAPEIGLDDPLDPKLANQPLEPGSGAPDLNAIIRRVRDERGPGNSEVAKSDFIAAARRAAQAAAAEAQSTKRHSEAGVAGGKTKLGGIFKTHRKTMLLAATALMVVLAGMQLSKAFLSSEAEFPAEVSTIEETEQPAVDLAAEEPMLEETPTASVRMAEASTVSPQARELVTSAESPNLFMQAGEEEAAAASPLPPEMADDAIDPVETAAPRPAGPAADAGPVALREAADDGDPKAMFEVGSRHAEGRGTKADLAKAAIWYERAADLGYAPAQYRLGNFYEKGNGVERDIANAKAWYEKAAKQGNASAMHNLAVLHAMGAEGEADNDAAARWFLEAAELGVKDSQYNLGILAAKGAGVPQSLEESYKWFALVAKTGDRDAASKRDEVAKALRPEQLEKARAATELWKARELDPEANIVDIPEEWSEDEPSTGSVDMKQAIRNIQAILNKNGYDAGPADGVMGQKTKGAIAAFQADNGMPANGEITQEFVKTLLERK